METLCTRKKRNGESKETCYKIKSEGNGKEERSKKNSMAKKDCNKFIPY